LNFQKSIWPGKGDEKKRLGPLEKGNGLPVNPELFQAKMIKEDKSWDLELTPMLQPSTLIDSCGSQTRGFKNQSRSSPQDIALTARPMMLQVWL